MVQVSLKLILFEKYIRQFYQDKNVQVKLQYQCIFSHICFSQKMSFVTLACTTRKVSLHFIYSRINMEVKCENFIDILEVGAKNLNIKIGKKKLTLL